MLSAWYWSDDTLRSRRVSDVVLSGVLDIPAPPARLRADWERELASHVMLEPGDVDPLPLARARMRWPDYARCVQAVTAWMETLGIAPLFAAANAAGDVALMACRGARFHHDGAQYGGAAFCNLFVSDDQGLDVLFPATGTRIPLTRGTVMLFDTCQPHGVVKRGDSTFDEAGFAAGAAAGIDCVQTFLTWELPIEAAPLAQALGIAFDVAAAAAPVPDDAAVLLNGQAVAVCEHSGQWRRAAV